MYLKKLKKFLCRRAVIISIIVIFELLFLFAMLLFCCKIQPVIGITLRIVTIVAAFYLIFKSDNPAYKIAWLMLMLILPELGGAAYLLGGNKRLPKRLKRRLADFNKNQNQKTNSGVEIEIALKHPRFYPISLYLKRCTGFCAWQNTKCEFFPTGKLFFDSLCNNLNDAKSFIFLEYFIISNGKLWQKIKEILVNKLQNGVAVFIMYDDMGCIDSVGKSFFSTLKSAGAKIAVFNRCRPKLNPAMNYRNHRKTCVIDGNIGYCGGANIADEYINHLPRCGHWKDSGIMLRGDGVWNLTLLFLSLWDFSQNIKTELSRFVPTESCISDGFVQPFGDTPLDSICACESVCMMAAAKAERFIYITTPYLILDHEMIRTLSTAALSGTDVRIITPAVPDKWYVHAVSRSFYAELISCGVKIFEYSPGFVHSKQLICDDIFAMVGTANMDFRSFYLHFESAVCLFGSSSISDIKRDFLQMLECSREISFEDTKNFPLLQRMTAFFLRPFSPLF